MGGTKKKKLICFFGVFFLLILHNGIFGMHTYIHACMACTSINDGIIFFEMGSFFLESYQGLVGCTIHSLRTDQMRFTALG